jgi:hypothetical protein
MSGAGTQAMIDLKWLMVGLVRKADVLAQAHDRPR